jgi:ligand-binding sensor domain-containing protein
MKIKSTLTLTGLAAIMLAITAPLHAQKSNWKNLTVEDGLPANEIQFIQGDANGNVWVGTLKGMVEFEDGELSEPLIKGSVFDVMAMDEERLLLGTSRGAKIVKDGEVVQEMLKGNYVAPIMRFSEDRIWALKRKGGQDAEINVLVEYVDGEWSKVEALEDRSIVDLQKTPDGRVWVLLDGDGVAEFDPKKGTENFTHHLEGLSVTSLFHDSKKRLWVGMWGSGVSVLTDGRWKDYLQEREAYVFDIVEDDRGQIWVSTNNDGLWRYNKAEWHHHLGDQGAVNLLKVMDDGTVVISAARTGGLQYWTGEEWKVSLPGPLPIRTVYELENGTVLAGGVLDGLHVLPADQ